MTRDGRCPSHQRKWAKRTTVTVNGWEEQRRAKRVIARDHGVCYVCGLMGADQADHVVNLAAGGADDESNMNAIHGGPGSCHEQKTRAEMARLRKMKGRALR